MKIVYMATADLACSVLDALNNADEHDVVAVLSQPDRPAGRKRVLTPSAVKARAVELGIPVLTPEKIGSPESIATLEAIGADLFVVFAYGQYIPTAVTDMPRHRSINIHPSLLPKYRGASPIQFTLMNGDEVGGVSIIYVTKDMDAGDVLGQVEMAIAPEDTYGSLSTRMADAGGKLILSVIDQLAEGTANPVVQDPDAVVECRKLTKEDGVIDWSETAEEIHNKVRAFNPWPSCSFLWNGLKIKVHRTAVEKGEGTPGQILEAQAPGPLIATATGALRLLEIQPPGKKAMTADAFLRGNPMNVGEQLITD